jgi:hypothetical protein
MGIPAATARFLIEAQEEGASFRNTATIGRQHLMIGAYPLSRMLRHQGLWPADMTRRAFYAEISRELWMADPLFRMLGAEEITAIDASAYEGADVVWDLNEPVPSDLHSRFDVVFDGGSLEHIFHAPVAIQSYMRLVRVGGHLLVTSPANNYYGHGLYQFSPEFFFATLTEENGYFIERMIALPMDVDAHAQILGSEIPIERSGRRYAVARPSEIRERVQLVTRQPVMLMIQARRIADAPIFAKHPQQSDYASRWGSHGEKLDGARPAGRRRRATALMGRSAAGRVALQMARDVVPIVAPVLDPFWRLRAARRRSFRNSRHHRRM